MYTLYINNNICIWFSSEEAPIVIGNQVRCECREVSQPSTIVIGMICIYYIIDLQTIVISIVAPVCLKS